MKTLSGIVASILISGLTTAAIITTPQPVAHDSLSAAIEKQLDANAALPASYAIVDGEDITFGSREGAGPDTPFVLGSVSKSFTSLAVMVAVERGEVSLDAPVTDYLPDFRLKASGAEPIRIRHLLNHTSGISTVDCNLDSSTPLETVKARVDQLQSITPESKPGARFVYCNVGFAILARVLEENAGDTFAHVLQTTVLTPLGMSRTFTDMQTARENGLAEGYATVMGFPISRPEDGAASALADGYLISTARDLATYTQFQMGNGRTRDGNPLISVDLLHEMHRGTVAVPGSEGTELANYAMGWFTAIVNGITVVTHGGTNPRYHANVAMVPSEHRAVIALVAGQWLSGAGSTSSGAVGLLLKQDAGVSQMYHIVTALLWLVTLLLMVTLVISRRRSLARRRDDRRPRVYAGPLLLIAAVTLFVGLAAPGIQQTGSIAALVQFGWENTPDLLVLVLAWPLVLAALGMRSIVERARSRTVQPQEGRLVSAGA